MAAPLLASIVGATNAAPIVMQTGAAHGFTAGDQVAIFGVLGNLAANSPPGQPWTIAIVDSTHFSLTGSVGNGAYLPAATGFAADLSSGQVPAAAAITPDILGHDLSCVTDLDPALAEVDGFHALAQACVRRITTPRGTLIDDPNYGIDVRLNLNDDLGSADLGRIGAQVDAELVKDERVLGSQTTVTLTGNLLLLSIAVVSQKGPFVLVLTASAVTVQLLTVQQ